jgi:hypothetical protein
VASIAAETGVSVNHSDGSGQSIALGSSVRDVTLASPVENATEGTLTSSKKDFKLEGGMRIAVEMESN